MCGIIGYTGGKDAVRVVLDGLKRLEYRGYDSAGIAFHGGNGITVIRKKGKINDLNDAVGDAHKGIRTAIGHTRWATHGKPSEENAHPHRSHGIAIVHNGIIENYLSLRRELESDGYRFTSETDSEVICHLIDKNTSEGRPLEEAVREATRGLKGAYAITVISEKEPDKIVGARKDSPLVVGVSEGEAFIASDVPAFLSHTNRIIFLDDEEMAVLTPGSITITDFSGTQLKKDAVPVPWSPTMADKGGFKHFMLKEIHEQPRALADTMRGRFDISTGEVYLSEFGLEKEYLSTVRKIFIAACGTSWHAALCGRQMIERLAKVPVEVDISSEFRYRGPIVDSDCLFISITQSGETADTLAAQREAIRLGARTLTICNVIGSTTTREAQSVFYTRSGPEIGVASTKAFTTQLVALFMFAVALAGARGTVNAAESRALLDELLKIPDKVEQAVLKENEIEKASRDYFKSSDFLYLGRGLTYPIALEGALKLKEISYIHAEGYPAGEMKHGPIALIDEDMPVLFIAPNNELLGKVMSNMEEVRSRGGRVICITDDTETDACASAEHCIFTPKSIDLLTPVIMTVPLQLLAYHIGVLRGCDVDQPRNLAKSVTVE